MKRKGILLCLAINLSGCAAFNGGFDGLNGQSSFFMQSARWNFV
ncbi:hypothetical protein BANRA_04281 [Acinetobacter baumannii]|nr:hypothetical protein BANRA_04281 [Acinetobacter baumannii]